MYLTEKFIRQHPPGTRVRHPLYGAARIAEATAEGLVVEWESPLARIEQSNRIPASEVPYMGRIVEQAQMDPRIHDHLVGGHHGYRRSGPDAYRKDTPVNVQAGDLVRLDRDLGMFGFKPEQNDGSSIRSYRDAAGSSFVLSHPNNLLYYPGARSVAESIEKPSNSVNNRTLRFN